METSEVTVSGGKVSIRRVLIIYTGGTIGMKETKKGYIPAVNYLKELLGTLKHFHETGQPLFTTPVSKYGTRIKYDVIEYDPLLDSSNMTPKEWIMIASDIEKYYDSYDGFVVLHGTDTMSYTCSALSFILENLAKTVVITGSQIPLSQHRNDAEENLLSALTIAGNFEIPEVCLYFRNHLYRGNRTSKVDASGLDAFGSGNYPTLADVGIDIQINWDFIRPVPQGPFQVHKQLNVNVGSLRLFPGITVTTVKNFLAPPMQGIVLETYGAGNAPDQRQDFLDVLKEANERGVVILNCTQCFRGSVKADYATGVALSEAGVISAMDMTAEASLTKLMYLLGKPFPVDKVKELLQAPLRGEMKAGKEVRISFRERDFIKVIARALYSDDIDHQSHFQEISKVLSPTLMCSAAAVGDTHELSNLLRHGVAINIVDYDGRTALHLAACEGHLEAVKFLLDKGADVNAVDRWGGTPLDDAIRHRRKDVALFLKEKEGVSGAGNKLVHEACEAAGEGNLEKIKNLAEHGVDVKKADYDGRTPLHLAASEGHTEIVKYLVHLGADVQATDRFGNTPLCDAVRKSHVEVIRLLNTQAKAEKETLAHESTIL